MRRLAFATFVLVASAAALSTAVPALEEQRGPAPSAVQPPDDAKANVQAESSAPQASAGTEIRIPGLGKLGTLPKMDFGLELLYGADQTPNHESATPQEDPQDLTIHGSMKHRF